MTISVPKPATADGSSQKLRIGFILARSFTLSAFALFVDTLRLASDELDRSGRVLADWHVLNGSRNLIPSSCGVQVAPTSDFIDPVHFHYIVVVGGLLTAKEPVDRDTIAYLHRASAAKVPLIGVCTGTFILAAAGLMKQHQTCVSWLHFQAFREQFPDHRVRSDRLYNLDRNRGSCAGGSSAADMAASIVRRYISKAAERNAMEVLQIEKARSHLHIQPRRPLAIDSADTRIRAVLILMEGHLDGTITIPKMAAAVGLSRRQLERLFLSEVKMSPMVVYKKVRMEHAKTLLMRGPAPLIEIAVEVGFSSASHFSRVFKALYGITPTQLRSDALTGDRAAAKSA
ncbi:AraC family transcriptional regulator [Metarhizobium album]|uniref:AraC family transcriptional regulator n=1 Tax=Metarhizobium album TaxID=2182425 RepID=A0A2U2DNK2_9HYPH|nr:GlxA family transcriptional regulator [Rhizobium album]OJU07189.1 MAG: AraC family transcriptional regulator [Rhizobium sp. 63-7]PWE54896.1 AraC family transcriptional regulator [Rhizobium album]